VDHEFIRLQSDLAAETMVSISDSFVCLGDEKTEEDDSQKVEEERV